MLTAPTSGGPSDLLIPKVLSEADPDPQLLMAIRSRVAVDESLKSIFSQFRSENRSVPWLRDMLVAPLFGDLISEWDIRSVTAACQYLADEYHQLPADSMFLVSTETGKVQAVFSEDDLYNPGFLPRESGEMARALDRLRPDKEVALVSYYHAKAVEEKVLQTLATKYPQTQLLREDGDQRFRMASRRGRTAIARDLSEDDPRRLLGSAGGSAGAFLRHFPVLQSEVPEGYTPLSGVATFRSTVGVQDALTINPAYSRLGNLRAAAAQGWVRDICRDLSKAAHDRLGASPVAIEDVTAQDLRDSQLWVATPDSLVAFKRVDPKTIVVPVEGSLPIGLSGVVGYLEVESEFLVESHERFQRWEVVASVKYVLHVKWGGGGLTTLLPLGIPVHTEVEVL